MTTDRRHRHFLAYVGALTGVVLVLTALRQIGGSDNFHLLWEATSLLGGDHPYRDFFDWGAPLQMLASTGMQWLVGYRLLGEFLLQAAGIIAGAILAFHLGLRLSRSLTATIVMFALALPIMASTMNYHYPKLFFFPLVVLTAWRYIEKPDTRRAAVLGAVAAIAFLYRHDYGVYIGVASVLTLGLSRCAAPASRRLTLVVRESAAYAAAVLVIVTPWIAIVQASEGFAEYVRMRIVLYEGPQERPVYASLLELNPVRALQPEPKPPVTPGVVAFKWKDGVDETRQRDIEARYHLQPLAGERDGQGRLRFAVPNLFDEALFELDPYITDGAGFEWDRMREMRIPLPTRAAAADWLQQVTLLVPVLLLSAGAYGAWQARRRLELAPTETWLMLLAGAFLIMVDSSLIREQRYLVTVTPITAALAARLIAGPAATRWSPLRAVVAILLIGVTAIDTFAFARTGDVFRPAVLAATVPEAYRRLMASPPIDGYAPAAQARQFDWSSVKRGGDIGPPLYRYVHDCTAPEDRLLITGPSPYDIGYYTERRVAGGHVYWRQRWRSDPDHEARLLALLKQQSVPFAVSSLAPVLDDLRSYPEIAAYLKTNYAEVEGTGGLVLVDRRRQPSSRFGIASLPCFR